MRHPGLLHLYHPPDGDVGAPGARRSVAADALRDLVPDAGHLQHMPTHIDVLCGDYERVMEGNAAAIAADDRYVEHAGAAELLLALPRARPPLPRLRGMFAGNQEAARAAADAMRRPSPRSSCACSRHRWPTGSNPTCRSKLHVLIRFGRWHELIAPGLPGDHELYASPRR